MRAVGGLSRRVVPEAGRRHCVWEPELGVNRVRGKSEGNGDLCFHLFLQEAGGEAPQQPD